MDLKTLFLATMTLIFAVSVGGCVDKESVVPDEEAMDVLAYADPIVESALTGFNENNYELYSHNFSSEMRQVVDEAAFDEDREFVTSRIGLYKSKRDPTVTETGDYIAVTYKADFEREDGVDARFVFKKDDEVHRIHGIWFNSPELRS